VIDFAYLTDCSGPSVQMRSACRIAQLIGAQWMVCHPDHPYNVMILSNPKWWDPVPLSHNCIHDGHGCGHNILLPFLFNLCYFCWKRT